MYTYILKEENNNLFKIGKTENIARRVRSLQTGNSRKLRLIGYFTTDIEHDLHTLFKEKWVKGEWFRDLQIEKLNELGDFTTCFQSLSSVSINPLKNKKYQKEKTNTILYHHNDINSILFDCLSHRGRDMFLYIIYKIPKNSDFITLKHSIVRKHLKISKPTIIASIKELIAANILHRKSQSEYWINPDFLFNGDRVEFYSINSLTL